MDIELFKQRLIETATWSQGYSQAEHGLLSLVLQPVIEEDFNVEGYEGVRFWDVVGSSQDAVEFVSVKSVKRATLIGKARIPLSAVLLNGRLLSYDYHATLSDGGSAAFTNGFFGDEDTPPWDTWVCDNAAIITWIPNQYIGLADEGAEVSMGRTLHWLDELDTNFTHQLRAAALL